ncbi:hypothetical protein [Haloplanus salinarum]|jgi:hypothetical protein|uniref:hypothetical protein n=1 Tax=Haloplanus salinarum TaxID=1912324 RepID=UPI00214C9674|nr:hypothetical protein [Haloplanus salinarum]
MIRDVTEEVSYRRFQKLQERARTAGELEERIVAEAFDLLDVSGDDAEDADLRNPRTQARYEVKSANATVGSGNGETEDGRFRLWEDQHRSIVGYDAQPDLAGWYVFVRCDRQGTPQVMRRVEPSTVTKLVDGRWNDASHEGRDARQYKLPIGEVFDERL